MTTNFHGIPYNFPPADIDLYLAKRREMGLEEAYARKLAEWNGFDPDMLAHLPGGPEQPMWKLWKGKARELISMTTQWGYR